MAVTKLTPKNYRWVEEHRQLAIAAANLRGQAGMSERDIYETMKKEVAPAHAPDYRDLRAAFKVYHAKHEQFEGMRHRRIDPRTGEVEDLKTKGPTRFRIRYNAQFGEADTERLLRKTVVGYMIQAKGSDRPEEWRDPEAYIEWERSQSYDETPPF